MAFFGLFGNKGIDSISSKDIKDARTEHDLKLSVALKKYENLGTKVRAVLSEAKSQSKMQRMVTAKRYKAVKRDFMTQGREVTTLSNHYSMLSSLLFVKENYEELDKKGVINKILNDKNLDEKLTNMAKNIQETDQTIENFTTMFDAAADGISGTDGAVLEMEEDIAAEEKALGLN